VARPSRLCQPCATPSSNSSLDYRRDNARIAENGFATSSGVNKSAKVVLEREVANDPAVSETDRLALIWARRGQGLFKDRVSKVESRCRITGVENPVHLVGSHCKPWRDSTNEERLNGENGLLLTPSIDHLFDRGFISFEDSGTLIISPVAHRPSLQRMGIDVTKIVNVGGFTSGQKQFLDFHRNSVLLQSTRA